MFKQLRVFTICPAACASRGNVLLLVIYVAVSVPFEVVHENVLRRLDKDRCTV